MMAHQKAVPSTKNKWWTIRRLSPAPKQSDGCLFCHQKTWFTIRLTFHIVYFRFFGYFFGMFLTLLCWFFLLFFWGYICAFFTLLGSLFYFFFFFFFGGIFALFFTVLCWLFLVYSEGQNHFHVFASATNDFITWEQIILCIWDFSGW